MKLFYSFELQKKHTDKVLEVIKRQVDNFSDSEQLQPSSSSPHYELYETTEEKPYKFYWIGIRLNLSSRLIGAIVSGASFPGRYFFALEILETHDYQKSLVEREPRRKNWQAFIQQFIDDVARDSQQIHDETFGQTSSGFVQHEGRYRALNAQQADVLEAPIHQGSMCFGGPGTGKTLIAHQRAEEYMRASLTTAYLAPTPLLIDATVKEMDSRGLDRTKLRVFTWENFVLCLDAKPEFGHLGFAMELKGTLVDMALFGLWYREQLKTASHKTLQVIKEMDLKIIPLLWHEFHCVFFQPNWSDPSQPYLSEERYIGLGIAQSNFPVESRKDLYAHVFIPFYREIQLKKAYCPTLLAHRLYNALQKIPQQLSDALVVDEMQKFHPWQLACVLSTLNNPLSAGQFCLVGDAGQGVEKQALRIAEPMKLFFETNEACVRSYCLEINHRSSQVVTRFIAQIHELEHRRLGSSERDTHTRIRLSSQAPEGEIGIQDYNEAFRRQIEQNANAYIVIPHPSMHQKACEHWTSSQVVALCEFQGMAAHTIVMYGFSDYYADQLRHINATTETLPDWDSASPYARRSKGVWDALSDRECLQALYTASSRATHTLIMIENAPLITRLLTACTPAVSSAISEDRPVMMAETALNTPQPIQIKTDRPKGSLKDWFLRARNDFTNGLVLQAKEILCRRDLWSSVQVEKIESMLGRNEAIDWDAIESILFPKSTTKPLNSTVLSSTARMTTALKTPLSVQLSPKWSEWVESLFNKFTTANIESLLSQSNLAQLLFSHKMINGFCLYINLSLDAVKCELFHTVTLPKKKSSLINESYNSLAYKPVLLEFMWAEQHNNIKGSFASLIQRISVTTDKQSKRPLIYELLSTEIGIQRFRLNFDLFKNHLTPVTFCCREYPSWMCLKNSIEGLGIVQNEAAFFRQKALIMIEQFEELEYIALLKDKCASGKKVKSLGCSPNFPVNLMTFESENGGKKNVVIKSQPCSLMSEEVFQRNRSDLLDLYHPNIIRYFDVIRENDQTVRLIMDYSDAGSPDFSSLDSWIHKFHNSFPTEIMLAFSKAVGLQLMMALSYLHQVGKTTHGFLTPEHILINKEGRVMLCNVRLAKFCSPSTPTEQDRYHDRIAAVKIIYAIANSYTREDVQVLMMLDTDHFLTDDRFVTEQETVNPALLHDLLMAIVDQRLRSPEACLQHPFFPYEMTLENAMLIPDNAITLLNDSYGFHPAMTFEDRMKRWDEIEKDPSSRDEQKNAVRKWMCACIQIVQERSSIFIKTEIVPHLIHEKPLCTDPSEWQVITSLNEHVQYIQLSAPLMKRLKFKNRDSRCVIQSLLHDESNEGSLHAPRRAVTIMERSKNHPNIIRMLTATRCGNNRVHIFCEASHLGSLQRLIETAQIPRDSIIPFLMATTCQVLSALLFLHGKLNVYHRSISSEHILFFEEGYVKLCSFNATNRIRFGASVSDMQQLSRMLLMLIERMEYNDRDDAVMLKNFAIFIASNSPYNALLHESMRPYYKDTGVKNDEMSKRQERLKTYGIEGTFEEQMKLWEEYDKKNLTSKASNEIRFDMREIFLEKEHDTIQTIKVLLRNVPAYLDAPQVAQMRVDHASNKVSTAPVSAIDVIEHIGDDIIAPCFVT